MSRKSLPEAFQMTEENAGSNMWWPNWAHEAWNKERNELGSMWGENMSTTDRKMFCSSSRGTEEITIDSWLVKEKCGGITVCIY